MKISCIKTKNDDKSFKVFKNFGIEVYELEDPEKTDKQIKELVDNKYETIILTDEIASFSEDIIKKYRNNNEVNIIITKRK